MNCPVCGRKKSAIGSCKVCINILCNCKEENEPWEVLTETDLESLRIIFE